MTLSERGGIKLLKMGSVSQWYLLSMGCHFVDSNPSLVFSWTSFSPSTSSPSTSIQLAIGFSVSQTCPLFSVPLINYKWLKQIPCVNACMWNLGAWYVCPCAKVFPSCLTLRDRMGCSSQAPLSMGFSSENTEVGCYGIDDLICKNRIETQT